MTRFEVTRESHFWVCLWGPFQRSLIRRDDVPWLWVAPLYKGRKEETNKGGHSSPLCLTCATVISHLEYLPQPDPISPVFLLSHDGCKLWAKIDPFPPCAALVRHCATAIRKLKESLARREELPFVGVWLGNARRSCALDTNGGLGKLSNGPRGQPAAGFLIATLQEHMLPLDWCFLPSLQFLAPSCSGRLWLRLSRWNRQADEFLRSEYDYSNLMLPRSSTDRFPGLIPAVSGKQPTLNFKIPTS